MTTLILLAIIMLRCFWQLCFDTLLDAGGKPVMLKKG